MHTCQTLMFVFKLHKTQIALYNDKSKREELFIYELPHQYLVHVHIPMFNTPMSKMILQQAISNVLLQSSSQINIKTLVLPSLGTGIDFFFLFKGRV